MKNPAEAGFFYGVGINALTPNYWAGAAPWPATDSFQITESSTA
jgi:hypothetical protein